MPVVREPVDARVLTHRRDENPVGERQRAKRQRFEEVRHRDRLSLETRRAPRTPLRRSREQQVEACSQQEASRSCASRRSRLTACQAAGPPIIAFPRSALSRSSRSPIAEYTATIVMTRAPIVSSVRVSRNTRPFPSVDPIAGIAAVIGRSMRPPGASASSQASSGWVTPALTTIASNVSPATCDESPHRRSTHGSDARFRAAVAASAASISKATTRPEGPTPAQ